MELDARAVAIVYSTLPREERLRILAAVGENLSSSAKGVQFDYRELLVLANEKLLVISDLQGRVAGMMSALLTSATHGSDGDFIGKLFATAEAAGIADELTWAFAKPLEEMQVHS